MKDLGCAKCRYSASGCARCRNPSFRPRGVVPAAELRQVIAEQRRQQRARQQDHLKEQRRQDIAKAGTNARESLLSRLRNHLNATDEDAAPASEQEKNNDAATRNAASPVGAIRNAAAADLAIPEGQPPAKYRRTEPQQPAFIHHINDEEMTDASPPPPESPSVAVAPAASPNLNEQNNDIYLPQQPETGQKRAFLDLLSDNMAKRREARLSGASSPLAKALGGSVSPPAAKRQKRPNTSSPISALSADHPQKQEQLQTDLRNATWDPPVSPYGLIEEELYSDPWKLLLACMLLNKTTGHQVRSRIWDFFKLCPTPQATIAADSNTIQDLIQPLGLHRKRAVAVQRMSEDYLTKEWKDPKELYGVGQYGSDAYWIFCRGLWREVDPEDKDLKRYVEWLKSTGGLGTGLMR